MKRKFLLFVSVFTLLCTSLTAFAACTAEEKMKKADLVASVQCFAETDLSEKEYLKAETAESENCGENAAENSAEKSDETPESPSDGKETEDGDPMPLPSPPPKPQPRPWRAPMPGKRPHPHAPLRPEPNGKNDSCLEDEPDKEQSQKTAQDATGITDVTGATDTADGQTNTLNE